MAKKKKIKCDPRRPWAYPSKGIHMDKPKWAAWCPCGWRVLELKTEEEATKLTEEHKSAKSK